MSQHPPSNVAATADEIAHAFEEEVEVVDLSSYSVEDWITQVMFWAMAVAVFIQFFTRYVLNDSLAWTEEVAINFLVGVVFFGSIMCVRQSRHIQVDVLYHYIPSGLARVLSLFVDIVRIAFFGYGAYLVWKYSSLISEERMTMIDLPKSIVFYTVMAGFALMCLRAVQVMIENLRRGYSVLERPDAFMPPTGD
ncbi:TRAP transporter small permease (plasmid) [Skermanella mucosa]|uniref:TRAP transporter small permease n=1 Tax=Skermanella mucosa TaxID=1789672 RepID=UPI00192CC1C0|nr:TRAP transporter small permease [Skermanella mucosa]UEM24806.1 TRAP transporter small permease [Skermanella mucosa]